MGADEEGSALVVVVDDKAPPSLQVPFDPTVQQRWSELETVNLIAAYQEKWYLLKRGQLKARHWEEVANKVFLLGGSSEPSKSSVQCRHKLEKLRKKYRVEKQLEEQQGPGSSTWPYFEHMVAMERGSSLAKPDGGNGNRGSTRVRLRRPERRSRDHNLAPNNDTSDTGPLPRRRMRDSVHVKGGSMPDVEHTRMDSPHVTLRPKLDRSYSKDDGHSKMADKAAIADANSESFSKRMRTELASVIRGLGEGFLKIEQMKLEMQRDNERLRAEVELKRMGMLLDSQKKMAEMFTRALTGKRGVKKRQLQEL